MTKYGWRHIAKEQGWKVLIKSSSEGCFGLIARKGLAGYAVAETEAEVLDQLEAWWRAQATA